MTKNRLGGIPSARGRRRRRSEARELLPVALEPDLGPGRRRRERRSQGVGASAAVIEQKRVGQYQSESSSPLIVYSLFADGLFELYRRYVPDSTGAPAGCSAPRRRRRETNWRPQRRDIARTSQSSSSSSVQEDVRVLGRVTGGCPSVLCRSAVRQLPWSRRTAASSRIAGA